MVYFSNYTYYTPHYKIINELKNGLESGGNMGFKVPRGINKVPFSIRVDEKDYKVIDKLSKKNKKSYNFIVNAMIKYAIDNMDMEDIKNVNIEED